MCYFTFEDNTEKDNTYARRGYHRAPQTQRERWAPASPGLPISTQSVNRDALATLLG